MSNSITSFISNVNPYDSKEWFLNNLPSLDNDTLQLLYSKLDTLDDVKQLLAYLNFKYAKLPISIPISPMKPKVVTNEKPTIIFFNDNKFENALAVSGFAGTNVALDFVRHRAEIEKELDIGDFGKIVDQFASTKKISIVYYHKDDTRTLFEFENSPNEWIVVNETNDHPGLYRFDGPLEKLPQTFSFVLEKRDIEEF